MSATIKQALTERLLTWPEVAVQPHRFGGIEFVYKNKEIGHLHGDRLLDLLLPRSLRDQLLAAGRAQPHHIYPDSNWVSLYLNSDEDVVDAIAILRDKYDTLRKNDVQSFAADHGA